MAEQCRRNSNSNVRIFTSNQRLYFCLYIYFLYMQRHTHKLTNNAQRLLLIWSRTHSVPGHLVPHNWSPRTNSPDPFGPHGQMVPKTIGPQEQTVPANLVPMDKWSPRQLVPWDNWSPKSLLFVFVQKLFLLLFSITNGICMQKII